jgi:hypothetical protein
MFTSKAALEIILRARDEASRTVGQASKSFGVLQGAVAGLATGGVMLAGKAVVGLAKGAVQAGGALLGMVQQAAPIEGIGAAFRSVATDADATLNMLRAGAQGMVSDANLMLQYNSAVQLVGKSFADDLPDAMQYLSKVSASTGKDMGYLLDSLTTGVGRLSPMILDNLGIQVDLASATARAAEMYGLEADALSKAQIQAGMMSVVLEKLEQNTAGLPDVTENAATKMAQLRTMFQNVKDEVGVALIPVLMELLVPLGELAMQYGPMLVQWFVSLIPVIKEAVAWFMSVETNVEGMSAKVGAALALMQPIFSEVWGFILQLTGQAVAWFQANLPLIIATGQALADFFQNHVAPTLDNVWAIIKTVVSTAMTWILSAITATMQVITGDWEGYWTTVKDLVATIWQAIQTIVTQFMEGVLNAIGTNLETFKGTWSSNWQMAKQIAATQWEQIKGTIKAKADAIVGDVRTFLGNVKSAISGFSLRSAGAQLINGLKAGIMSAAAGVVDAAKGVVADAIAAAKALLGIKSPSKVFAEMGAYAMQGFSLGLDDTSWMALHSMQEALGMLTGQTGAGHRYAVWGPGVGAGGMRLGGGAGGMTVIIHNHFERDSVRSYEDIEFISRKQQEMFELHGARTWEIQ